MRHFNCIIASATLCATKLNAKICTYSFKMSSKHLQKGDAKPAFDNTKKFRIYSMKFCPFAQRARLVAAAKGLSDFDIVNIKLRDDLPEWYPSINPFRKVPAIEFPDGESIYQSIVISDLLDELYPTKQLHPKDPKEKAKQKLFLERYGETKLDPVHVLLDFRLVKILKCQELNWSLQKADSVIVKHAELFNKLDQDFIPSFYKHGSTENPEETKQELVKNIGNVEQYLTETKSKYFGGDEAGMLDYMIWPWFERLPMVYTLSADTHPNLTDWFNRMQDEPAVKETIISKENFLKFYDGYRAGQVDYDFI